jgi:hypothetical protein
MLGAEIVDSDQEGFSARHGCGKECDEVERVEAEIEGFKFLEVKWK